MATKPEAAAPAEHVAQPVAFQVQQPVTLRGIPYLRFDVAKASPKQTMRQVDRGIVVTVEGRNSPTMTAFIPWSNIGHVLYSAE